MPIYVVGGMPRSGSTLLVNVLAQNPRFVVSGTSALPDVLIHIRNNWDSLQEVQAMPREEAKRRILGTLRGAFRGYLDLDRYEDSILLNKSRSWLGHMEMLEAVLGCKAKVLVPVRDVRSILASFEMLWRKSCATKQINTEWGRYHEFQTLPGRLNTFMAINGVVGIAYNRIFDAIHRGFRDRMHFVHFEQFTANPGLVMEGVYEFLGEKPFKHDFEDVEQKTVEDDYAYGWPDLHTIRSSVKPVPVVWPGVLGKFAESYEKLNVFPHETDWMNEVADIYPLELMARMNHGPVHDLVMTPEGA